MAIRHISEAKPKKKKFRKVHFLWVLLVVGVFVFVLGGISANLIKVKELDKQINDIDSEILALDNESAEIEDILNDETHDDYFEKIAREEYGYCKPGEKVYYNSSFGE